MLNIRCGADERKLFESSIRKNSRLDGRSCNCYREINSKNISKDEMDNSVEISIGKTRIIGNSSIKLEENKNSNCVNMKVFIKSLTFKKYEKDSPMNLNYQRIANTLQMIYSSDDCIDYRCLQIDSNNSWNIIIDILVMEDDGNLIDVAGLAIRNLLANMIIPAVKITEVDGLVELDIDPDPSRYSKLSFKVLPFVVTAYKIGSTCFFDPMSLESLCAEISITFAICPISDSIFSIHLDKIGSVSMDEFKEIQNKSIEISKIISSSFVGDCNKDQITLLPYI